MAGSGAQGGCGYIEIMELGGVSVKQGSSQGKSLLICGVPAH